MMAEGDIDGIELIRQARERAPQMKAIVLSLYDDTKHVDGALAAGAVAYVIKTAHPDDLRSAIRQAFSTLDLPPRACGHPVAPAPEKKDSRRPDAA
jgi:DNA-binding NarL/FixJ family response regulator